MAFNGSHYRLAKRRKKAYSIAWDLRLHSRTLGLKSSNDYEVQVLTFIFKFERVRRTSKASFIHSAQTLGQRSRTTLNMQTGGKKKLL